MIQISKTNIPQDLFLQYCIAIRRMEKVRVSSRPEIIRKMYYELDSRRQDLHNKILGFVKNDIRFEFALATEIEIILKEKK